MMKKVNVVEIIKGYEMDSQKTASHKPTNQAIIDMLENTALDSLTVEIARGGSVYNRGSVVECVVKYMLNEYIKGSASSHYKKSVSNEDFSTVRKNAELVKELGLEINVNYEIKCLSSIARASYTNKVESPIIMVDLRKKSKGVYLVQPNDLVFYNASSISDYNNGESLDLIAELLGLLD